MSEKTKSFLSKLAVPYTPDEFEVKSLLSDFGISCPKGRRFGPAEPVDTRGLSAPFVVKVCSGRILHKTEEGGVELGLDEGSLASAVSKFRDRFPGSDVLVEEQVSSRGVEFIVGGLRDPDFGIAVMVGAGGVLTELYRDVTFRLAPLPREEARRMLDELEVSPVLAGFRGMKLDADALAAVISKVGDLAVELGGLFDQLDLNPLVFTGKRWLALDAKLVLRGPKK
jgi:acetyl-CoA synthetase (ADP-forming)